MPQGGGKRLAKVSRDIFSKTFNHIFVFWPALKGKKSHLRNKLGWFFKQNVTHTGEGGEKSVTYYLNGP